eukprot:5495709-Alexandrium_andersonii.AAC.1
MTGRKNAAQLPPSRHLLKHDKRQHRTASQGDPSVARDCECSRDMRTGTCEQHGDNHMVCT